MQANFFHTKDLIEVHPFAPVLTPQATVLMMGTFPPTEDKWCMAFHYPNFYNDMWRIYGMVFFNDKNHFKMPATNAFNPDKIKAFLAKKGIASCPTVKRALREKGNASDKYLSVVESVDLPAVLASLPKLRWICTTGGKATEILLEKLNQEHDKNMKTCAKLPKTKPPKTKLPKTNTHIPFDIYQRKLMLYRLPSSSRAYPMKLEKKAMCYQEFFKQAGLLSP